MDNKFISKKLFDFIRTLFLQDPMPQQEPSYWLMKSEPDAYSIDTLKNDGVTLWDGIRNYQARNFMRNMNKGDKVFLSFKLQTSRYCWTYGGYRSNVVDHAI